MTTLSQFLSSFIDRTGIGFYGTLDAAPASNSTVTDLAQFADRARGTNDFDGGWIHLPLDTAAGNKVRRTTTVVKATGVLSVNRAYAAADGTYYRWTKADYHPVDYLIPLANRALQKNWQWWRTVLTVCENGDGEASTVGGTDSNASGTRATTAANVWQGEAALRVTNSALNGYHQYATFDAGPGRNFQLNAKVRIAVGTARLQIIDVTNSNTVLAEETTTGVGAHQEIQISGAFPSTCYRAAVRAGGDEANADAYWDDVTVYWEPLTSFALPSSVTQWKDESGSDLFRLYRQVNRLGSDGAWPARAYDLQLVPKGDYQLVYIPSAANPVVIEMGRELTWDMLPLVIEYRRPYSDFGTVAADTDASDCPLDLWVYSAMSIAAEEKNLNLPQWSRHYAEEQARGTSKLLSPPPDNNGGAGGFAYQRM